MRLETYKMAMSILLRLLTLQWEISRAFGALRSVRAYFLAFFHSLSFELNLFFEWSCPLKAVTVKLSIFKNKRTSHPDISASNEKINISLSVCNSQNNTHF